jgi:hypothetical protein
VEVTFAQELKVPKFASREFLAGKDARTRARELLCMTQEEFSAAFKGSPMKRAKLRAVEQLTIETPREDSPSLHPVR